MRIYPAIDIQNGNCVRLRQGDFNEKTVYFEKPVEAAWWFAKAGAKYIHIVDLDGARNGSQSNEHAIREIIEQIPVSVQLGGGIRTMEDIERKLALGVDRVILGTAAVQNPELVKDAVRLYNEKIVVGIDAKDGFVQVAGWEAASTEKAVDLALKMQDIGVATIVFTDIATDGMMQGNNLGATRQMVEKTKMKIIASGGVSSEKDLQDVAALGVEGVIVGKAIYERAIDLEKILNKYR